MNFFKVLVKKEVMSNGTRAEIYNPNYFVYNWLGT